MLGTDIFFRNGAYRPETEEGRKILAHELTHVAQNKRLEEYRGASREELEASDFSSLDCETTGLEFDSCQLISVNLSYTVGTEIRSYVAFYSLDYCLAHFPDKLERLPSQQAILDLVALALSRRYCSMHNRMFDQRVLLHAPSTMTPSRGSTVWRLVMSPRTSDPSSPPLPDMLW